MYELVIVLDSHRCMMNITAPKTYSITRQNQKGKIHRGTILSKSWNHYFEYVCANMYQKLEFSANETELYKKEDSWYLLLFNKEAFKFFFFQNKVSQVLTC